MKAYITTKKLLDWIARLIELDGRKIDTIAEELGYEPRTFRNIRRYDENKPFAYISERIEVLNKLTSKMKAADTARIEVNGSYDEFESLERGQPRVPETYRGYTIEPYKGHGPEEHIKTHVIGSRVLARKTEDGRSSVVETSRHKFAAQAFAEAVKLIDYIEDGGQPPQSTGSGLATMRTEPNEGETLSEEVRSLIEC